MFRQCIPYNRAPICERILKKSKRRIRTVTKLEEVDALVSLTAISLYMVMQSERYDGDIP